MDIVKYFVKSQVFQASIHSFSEDAHSQEYFASHAKISLLSMHWAKISMLTSIPTPLEMSCRSIQNISLDTYLSLVPDRPGQSMAGRGENHLVVVGITASKEAVINRYRAVIGSSCHCDMSEAVGQSWSYAGVSEFSKADSSANWTRSARSW